MRKIPLNKIFASYLSVIIFAQANLVSWAEANTWSDHRKGQERGASSSPVIHVAALPASQSDFQARFIESKLFSSTQLFNPTRRQPSSIAPVHQALSKNSQAILDSIQLTNGTIQDLYQANSSTMVPVVLFQDIHMNAEAQSNLAHLLQSLINQNQVSLVGIEGAFTPFDFRELRASNDAVYAEGVAREFLNQKRIAAHSYVGATSQIAPPPMYGIDDLTHYELNVKAYLDSQQLKRASQEKLALLQQNLQQEKIHLSSRQLQEFDTTRSLYHRGEIPLGAYLQKLGLWAQESNWDIDQFLAAYDLESKLDFSAVERERKIVFKKLLTVLNQNELSTLMAASQAYQKGQMGFGDYYAHLKLMCEQKRVSLRRFPAFDQYVRYVLLSDGVHIHALLDGVTQLESAATNRLATTAAEKKFLERSEFLSLAEKCVAFSLTASDWIRYQKIKSDDLSLSTFENFYREADIRSEKMVQNLLGRISDSTTPLATTDQDLMSKISNPKNPRPAVLITGGFHTDEICALLKKKNTSYVVISPKVTMVDENANAYLSVFARDKSPIEKIFSGEKLFISPISRASVGTTRGDGSIGKFLAPYFDQADSTYRDWVQHSGSVMNDSHASGAAATWMLPPTAWMNHQTFAKFWVKIISPVTETLVYLLIPMLVDVVFSAGIYFAHPQLLSDHKVMTLLFMSGLHVSMVYLFGVSFFSWVHFDVIKKLNGKLAIVRASPADVLAIKKGALIFNGVPGFLFLTGFWCLVSYQMMGMGCFMMGGALLWNVIHHSRWSSQSLEKGGAAASVAHSESRFISIRQDLIRILVGVGHSNSDAKKIIGALSNSDLLSWRDPKKLNAFAQENSLREKNGVGASIEETPVALVSALNEELQKLFAEANSTEALAEALSQVMTGTDDSSRLVNSFRSLCGNSSGLDGWIDTLDRYPSTRAFIDDKLASDQQLLANLNREILIPRGLILMDESEQANLGQLKPFFILKSYEIREVTFFSVEPTETTNPSTWIINTDSAGRYRTINIHKITGMIAEGTKNLFRSASQPNFNPASSPELRMQEWLNFRYGPQFSNVLTRHQVLLIHYRDLIIEKLKRERSTTLSIFHSLKELSSISPVGQLVIQTHLYAGLRSGLEAGDPRMILFLWVNSIQSGRRSGDQSAEGMAAELGLTLFLKHRWQGQFGTRWDMTLDFEKWVNSYVIEPYFNPELMTSDQDTEELRATFFDMFKDAFNEPAPVANSHAFINFIPANNPTPQEAGNSVFKSWLLEVASRFKRNGGAHYLPDRVDFADYYYLHGHVRDQFFTFWSLHFKRCSDFISRVLRSRKGESITVVSGYQDEIPYVDLARQYKEVTIMVLNGFQRQYVETQIEAAVGGEVDDQGRPMRSKFKTADVTCLCPSRALLKALLAPVKDYEEAKRVYADYLRSNLDSFQFENNGLALAPADVVIGSDMAFAILNQTRSEFHRIAREKFSNPDNLLRDTFEIERPMRAVIAERYVQFLKSIGKKKMDLVLIEAVENGGVLKYLSPSEVFKLMSVVESQTGALLRNIISIIYYLFPFATFASLVGSDPSLQEKQVSTVRAVILRFGSSIAEAFPQARFLKKLFQVSKTEYPQTTYPLTGKHIHSEAVSQGGRLLQKSEWVHSVDPRMVSAGNGGLLQFQAGLYHFDANDKAAAVLQAQAPMPLTQETPIAPIAIAISHATRRGGIQSLESALVASMETKELKLGLTHFSLEPFRQQGWKEDVLSDSFYARLSNHLRENSYQGMGFESAAVLLFGFFLHHERAVSAAALQSDAHVSGKDVLIPIGDLTQAAERSHLQHKIRLCSVAQSVTILVSDNNTREAALAVVASAAIDSKLMNKIHVVEVGESVLNGKQVNIANAWNHPSLHHLAIDNAAVFLSRGWDLLRPTSNSAFDQIQILLTDVLFPDAVLQFTPSEFSRTMKIVRLLASQA